MALINRNTKTSLEEIQKNALHIISDDLFGGTNPKPKLLFNVDGYLTIDFNQFKAELFTITEKDFYNIIKEKLGYENDLIYLQGGGPYKTFVKLLDNFGISKSVPNIRLSHDLRLKIEVNTTNHLKELKGLDVSYSYGYNDSLSFLSIEYISQKLVGYSFKDNNDFKLKNTIKKEVRSVLINKNRKGGTINIVPPLLLPNLCIENETIKDIRVHTFGKTGVDLINYIKKQYGYDFLMDGFLSKLPLDIPIAFGTEKMVVFKTKKRLTGEQMSWHNFKNLNNFKVTEKNPNKNDFYLYYLGRDN